MMDEAAKIEKFAPADLARLRERLMKVRCDSWQAAELIGAGVIAANRILEGAPQRMHVDFPLTAPRAARS